MAVALIALGAAQLARDHDDREPAPGANESALPSSSTSEVAGTTTTTFGSETVRGLRARIALLRNAPAADGSGYDRSRFAAWIDADGDGCDTRCEVLDRQRRSSLPGLPDGGWESVYDGYTTNDASELDVDHVVSLKEAWVSGAGRWDIAQRRAFANDLEAPELLAVTAATNRSKGDRDPAAWQPPNDTAWCDYVSSWVAVKLKWKLAADAKETRALANMATGCA